MTVPLSDLLSADLLSPEVQDSVLYRHISAGERLKQLVAETWHTRQGEPTEA